MQHYCKYLIFVPNLNMNIKTNWDALGIATSVLCAIHCALLPVLMSTLPVFGINIIHNSFFEWGMITLAFVVGSYSLFHGYIKHHRSLVPVLIFSFGFIFLVLKQFFVQFEILFLLIAVTLIISAHFYNYRLCHRSKCSSPHHKH
ncbi:MAG: MerC domain-containing protein [Ferruginibacter sp.]